MIDRDENQGRTTHERQGTTTPIKQIHKNSRINIINLIYSHKKIKDNKQI